MTIRIEVQPDCTIEIMRPMGDHSHFMHFPNLESAIHVIRFLLKKDLQQAWDERFVSQAEREARAAFKQLTERSPYRGQKS